uniref:TAFA chemokine like family member 5 n=1 Tax=Catagonus wagneri TaxID=51154 RepID=A0A8C3YNT3_9CETA
RETLDGGPATAGPALCSPGEDLGCPISASLAGQLAAGTCEIVTLDRDSSQPRRTIARQTARCACRKGQIAGTTRARPACVDARIIRTKQWCDMLPCLEGEGCDLLINRSGWTCTQPGGRIKTTTVRMRPRLSWGRVGGRGLADPKPAVTGHNTQQLDEAAGPLPRSSPLCGQMGLSLGCSVPSHGH